MNKKTKILYWINSAEHDLVAAESLYNSKRFDWCLYIGSLVIEKTLKAFIIYSNENNFPPKTHDLIHLTKKINYKFSDEHLLFFETVSNFNIEARYPDEKFSFYKLCDEEFTSLYFTKIKEMFIWLKSLMKL